MKYKGRKVLRKRTPNVNGRWGAETKKFIFIEYVVGDITLYGPKQKQKQKTKIGSPKTNIDRSYQGIIVICFCFFF